MALVANILFLGYISSLFYEHADNIIPFISFYECPLVMLKINRQQDQLLIEYLKA